MISTREQIQNLHAVYCQLTGFDLPLSFEREQAWYWWVQRKLSQSDLTLLIRHHRELARRGEKTARSLKFRSLIMNVDWAEEDLQEIKARQRSASPRPNQDAILRASGRGPSEALPPPQPTAV